MRRRSVAIGALVVVWFVGNEEGEAWAHDEVPRCCIHLEAYPPPEVCPTFEIQPDPPPPPPQGPPPTPPIPPIFHGSPDDEPHEVACNHPRLLFSSPQDVDDAFRKVNNLDSSSPWSQEIFGTRVINGPRFNYSSVTPGNHLATAHYATDPLLALLAPTDQARKDAARAAIDFSLAFFAADDPPYLSFREWAVQFRERQWFVEHMYRYVALTYDNCYSYMSECERAKFLDELTRIGASLAAGRFEDIPGNQRIAQAVPLALIAMAIEGDLDQSMHEVIDEPSWRTNSEVAEGNPLRYRSGIKVTCINNAPGLSTTNGCTYLQGSGPGNYTVENLNIPDAQNRENRGQWIRWHGETPGANVGYYVTYEFTPNVRLWKERARIAIQRNLDELWGDGVFTGGLYYGAFTLAWMTDAFEAFRRNGDVDFSQHPSVKNAVSWFTSELIPLRSGQSNFARVHNRNDSNYAELFGDGSVGRFPGAATYLFWMMNRFKQDPEGRDLAAAWLLRRGQYWDNETSWREALWANDALHNYLGPLGPSASASRFFDAQNVANYRVGDLNGEDDDWALLTFSGHPYSLHEHHQADHGAFSFYAAGEDFAIDPGWAPDGHINATSKGHNLVEFSYGQGFLCTGAGATGHQASGSGELTSQSMSGMFDTVHYDLRKAYVPFAELPLHSAPTTCPVRRADRFGALAKFSGGRSYAVIADSIDVNGTARDYTWGMHTAPGNAVDTSNGSPAAIERSGGTGTLEAFVTAAGAVGWDEEDWIPSANPEVGIHKRLKAVTNAIDPRFLVVLVPKKAGDPSGLVVVPEASPVAGRSVFTVSDGTYVDVVLRNETDGAVIGGGFETDADLVIVRKIPSGMVKGWTVFNGSYLRIANSVDLFRIVAPLNAKGSATYDMGSLAVTADEATEFTARTSSSVTSFKSGDSTHVGAREGVTFRWRGSRRLGDVQPALSYSVQEDFSSSVAPHWFTAPSKSMYSRPLGGEFCDEGKGFFTQYVSHTNRIVDSWRADLLEAPKSIFADAKWSGTFTVQPDSDADAEPKVVLHARTRDLALSSDNVNQESIRLEIAVPSGATTLTKRVGASTTATIWNQSVGAVAVGVPHSYEFTVDGSTVTFRLDGGPLLSGQIDPLSPDRGYFQWEDKKGMHIHYDDVKVGLLGKDLLCSADSQCDDGQFCTIDTCDPVAHACYHTARTCTTSLEPQCYFAYCSEDLDTCVEEAFDPPPQYTCPGGGICTCM